MIQDPNTQTDHQNNNITEEIGEQALHAVTGGCRGCKIVGDATYGQMQGYAAQTADATHSAKTVLGAAEKTQDFADLHHNISQTIGNAPAPGKLHCNAYDAHCNTFESIKNRPFPE